MQQHPYIDSLFSPNSIAIIGASRSSEKLGHIIFRNILSGGFRGTIFPVNKSGENILGLESICKVADIKNKLAPEDSLDLAVICISPDQVKETLLELAHIGTKAVIIVSASLKEANGTYKTFNDDLVRIAQNNGMILLGPASIGVVAPFSGLNTTVSGKGVQKGQIGFFSQSSSMSNKIFGWAKANDIGFSAAVHMGEYPTIDVAHILRYLADDPQTKVIIGYIENIYNGQRFLEAAHYATRKKPVIVLKSGWTSAGARVVSAHLGIQPSSTMAYDAAFRQTGILRVDQLQDLIPSAIAFFAKSLPTGNGVAIVGNIGAPAILASDACAKEGMTLSSLSSSTLNEIQQLLPQQTPLFNPIDLGIDADEDTLAKVVSILARDTSAHSVLLLAAETKNISLKSLSKKIVERTADVTKPILASIMGGEDEDEARQMLLSGQIPSFDFPEMAIHALSLLYRHNLWCESPMPIEICYRRDMARAKKVLNSVIAAKATELAEFQAFDLLRAYEMPILETKLARTSDEAVQIAKQIGKPVVLKIASPHIFHKTLIDGIALGLDSPEKIRKAFHEITTKASRAHKHAYIAGCLVQAMASVNSREVVIGFTRDDTFGSIVHFGVSGLHNTAFQDISCRLVPLSLTDAPAMVREVKAFPVLAGIDGRPPVKFTAIEDIMLIMSSLAIDFPEISEALCEPVLVNDQGALVAGMRVILKNDQK